MKEILVIFAAAIIVSCTVIPAKGNIKTELYGKALEDEDFTVIIGDEIIKVFNTPAEIAHIFTGIQRTTKNIWQWSALFPDSKGAEKIIEYRTNEARIVFLGHDYEDRNSYFGLKKGALTIRGIGIGSALDEVVNVYGNNDWLESHKESMTKGDAGFTYRFYNYPESSESKYPFFDYIYFEARDGVVVGIHFWRKQSDAE